MGPGGGTEKKKKKEKKEKKEEKEKVSHMCESIGHRPLRGCCLKKRRKEKRTSHPRIAQGQRYPMPSLERSAEEGADVL